MKNPAEMDNAYIAQFVGSGIELAIAKWYYRREWQVYNIDMPGWDDYPWFANVMAPNPEEGRYIWKPIGVVRLDLPNGEEVLAKRKHRAEFDDGGSKGELWVVKHREGNKYECEMLQLFPADVSPRWKVLPERIILTVGD